MIVKIDYAGACPSDTSNLLVMPEAVYFRVDCTNTTLPNFLDKISNVYFKLYPEDNEMDYSLISIRKG